jgi:hypothetical protein
MIARTDSDMAYGVEGLTLYTGQSLSGGTSG